MDFASDTSIFLCSVAIASVVHYSFRGDLKSKDFFSIIILFPFYLSLSKIADFVDFLSVLILC